jgi:hypothetical protein
MHGRVLHLRHVVAKVYCRVKPAPNERDQSEQFAAARHQERWHRPASTEGANAANPMR